ncbi:ectonucleotide pyrophosphatase/phosphodiesterase [Flavobacterium sp. TAB 87]|uniref:alkaline phosphatase family protein n=1 Tax=Flavobacterium sp. TAB 87 TaxID=1729581 RepID=UPI00076CD002|nr:ectonucleotide pyrophosphatase/phosphodiesterase [Flavobacterium sp. TAB 87]KVV15361.1 phosphonoacetate hydrolase [Flavobacterium sp. TAB 87]
MKNLFYFVFLLFVGTISAQKTEKPYVVLVSLDGFRWDYYKYFDTSNLEKIAAEGVKAKSMKPSYPTKTFPNHYSIATGLYPDHHGIVNNNFYDPFTKLPFALSTSAKNNPDFYGGNPIWNVAEEQGIKTASFYWPGSDTGTKSPSIYKKYDDRVPYETRIDTVIKWLQLPEAQRPHLITLYFDEPDHTGHVYGPLSKENKEMVAKMNAIVGELTRKLDALPIGKEINLIIVSDHGMTDITDNKKVIISNYLKESWVEYAKVINPIMSIKAKADCKDSIGMALKKVKHIHFWKPSEIPKRLHFGTNPRTLDYVIEARKGYSLAATTGQKISGGTHGYDNKNKDMHAIFYAKGPNFKVGKKVKTFQNVSVYTLIAHILDLKIEIVDGDFNEIKSLLKD